MIDRIIEDLEARLGPLRARIDRAELLFIEDLFNGVAVLPDDVVAFHVDGEVDPAGKLDNVSPGLSFRWSSLGVERFANGDRLRKSVRDFLGEHPDKLVAKLGDSELLISAPDPADRAALAGVLSKGVTFLKSDSLNALNKFRDDIEASCNDLAATVARSPGGFGMLDLASFIEKLTGADFGLMHLSNLGQSNRALTVLTTSSSAEALRELSRFIGLEDEALLAKPGGDDQPFPAVSLPQTIGAEMIGNAAVWGKPLASLTASGKRILILPITRPLVRREFPEESGGIAAADILFTFVDTLDQWLMEVLKACVDTFSSYRYGTRRFNLLAQLQAYQEPEVVETLDPVGSALPFGRLDIETVLNEVLYTTSAHSVSLRLYDPATRSLVVEASAVGAFDGAEVQLAPPAIAIKGNEHTSVVVFTFLRGTRDMPYVYLKRITPPVTRTYGGRTKTDHRTYIPPEYKTQGLEIPLLTRTLTRSEICFTLQQGRLAFGTLNIEAPFPAAFDQDIDYLKLIASALESTYRSLRQRIDGRWLIANAARSDSVHQLWQYQEVGTFFSEEQNQVLRAIFPPRSEHALAGRQKLSKLPGRLLAWVNTRYEDSLQEQVLNMLKFDHVSDIAVSALFAESAYVIARNIIQNAVKHGEPRTDLIFFDDRAWFGARATPCLRIHYRASTEITADVVDLLGAAPILHDDSDRVGYGMYNVGLLTRLLGGSLYVSRDQASSHLTIDVHLPLPETN